MIEFSQLIDYLNNLNSNNSSYQSYYNEIISFENKHFIPAVRFETALLLNLLARLSKPKNILEIGFGSGVSSIFTNMGLDNPLNFISLEKDYNRYERGCNLLNRLNVHNIKLQKEDAFNFLKVNQQKFDFIFLDSVKREYPQYLSPLKSILNENGILICDNILFGGKVVEPVLEKKYQTGVKLLKTFNEMLSEDHELLTTFLMVGDGLSLSIKKN